MSHMHTLCCMQVMQQGALLAGEPGAIRLEEPSMAAEDFSFYAQRIPAAFTFLGIGDAAKGSDAPLHSPRFQMNEAELPRGAALHAALALAFLGASEGSGAMQHSEL